VSLVQHPPDVAAPARVVHGRRFGFTCGLLALLVIALGTRLFAVSSTANFVPQTDAADYDREAVALVTTGGFPASVFAPSGGPTALRPPLFPLALAGVYELSGVHSATARWRAGRIAEALLGTIAVALLALIALRLWGRPAALLSAAVGAGYLPLILVGSSLMSESLFIPLMLGAVLLALLARDRSASWRLAAAAGLLVGLAALTRSVGILVALPVGALVWTGRPRWSVQALKAPLAVLAVAGAVLVPWTVRNAVKLHSFVPISTEAGGAFAGTYNSYARSRSDFPGYWEPPVVAYLALARADPKLNEAQVSSRLTQVGLDYIKAHPAYVLAVTFRSLERMLDLPGPALSRYTATYEAYDTGVANSSVYVFWIVGLIALAGLVTSAARRPPLAFWAVPAPLLLATVLFTGGTRYRSPADPFIVLLAVLAGLAAWRRLRRTDDRTGHRLPSPAA
jgi:4-amino-4-deoxy-L-arabinose transferase-like glycosyltransferase